MSKRNKPIAPLPEICIDQSKVWVHGLVARTYHSFRPKLTKYLQGKACEAAVLHAGL
jgi:hypothetical protein